jgi:hydrogenase nickel incorporation protein HypA/HybF
MAMHERSVVSALIEQVSEEAQRRGLGRVTAVSVDVGEFSGVEPALVRAAFDELAAAAFGRDVRLNLATTPLRARCRSCAREYPVRRFRFACPSCGSDGEVTAGERFVLVSIEAEPDAVSKVVTQ